MKWLKPNETYLLIKLKSLVALDMAQELQKCPLGPLSPLLPSLLVYSQARSPSEVVCGRQQPQAHLSPQQKQTFFLTVPAEVSGLMLIGQGWVP